MEMGRSGGRGRARLRKGQLQARRTNSTNIAQRCILESDRPASDSLIEMQTWTKDLNFLNSISSSINWHNHSYTIVVRIHLNNVCSLDGA